MKNILVVESSPMGEKSVSRRLTREVLSGLMKRNPASTVITRDLAQKPLPHLGAEQISAYYTPEEKRDDSLKAAVRSSDEAVAELLAADVVVIGAPMWNFGVPSALKAWIDHVVRAGRTFSMGADGLKGLVSGKKVYIVTASGGVFSSGPYKDYDFQAPYLRAVLGFLGLTDVTFVRAEGLNDPRTKDTAYEKARGEVDALFAA
jgi:FMN-dependent NADH-azoreductase